LEATWSPRHSSGFVETTPSWTDGVHAIIESMPEKREAPVALLSREPIYCFSRFGG
jgi:hypothetical protein